MKRSDFRIFKGYLGDKNYKKGIIYKKKFKVKVFGGEGVFQNFATISLSLIGKFGEY